VQSTLHFLGVAFVVQQEQTTEDFTAGGFADGETNTRLCCAEAGPKVAFGPNLL